MEQQQLFPLRYWWVGLFIFAYIQWSFYLSKRQIHYRPVTRNWIQYRMRAAAAPPFVVSEGPKDKNVVIIYYYRARKNYTIWRIFRFIILALIAEEKPRKSVQILKPFQRSNWIGGSEKVSSYPIPANSTKSFMKWNSISIKFYFAK